MLQKVCDKACSRFLFVAGGFRHELRAPGRAVVAQFQNVRSVVFESNSIIGDLEALGGLPALEDLSIFCNTRERVLGSGLGTLTRLRSLSFQELNVLTDADMAEVAPLTAQTLCS